MANGRVEVASLQEVDVPADREHRLSRLALCILRISTDDRLELLLRILGFPSKCEPEPEALTQRERPWGRVYAPP